MALIRIYFWPRGPVCERSCQGKNVRPKSSTQLQWPRLTRQGRYDRMTATMCKLTGEAPTNMRDFVKLHAAEFKHGPAHS
jgi:hypothetical protein